MQRTNIMHYIMHYCALLTGLCAAGEQGDDGEFAEGVVLGRGAGGRGRGAGGGHGPGRCPNYMKDVF
jgi:hypothetical protein